MHGTSLFLILLAKYGTPVLLLLLCAYIAYRNFLKKQKAAASAASERPTSKEELYTNKIQTVEGNGEVNIEIFSSGEKAAESGSDSFLTSMAKKFNAQHNKTSGDKTMSVSLRSIPSGTAAEYISTGKYQPECYTPSNTLFGELVKNEGVELTVEADRLVGNVAGILVSKKTGDMLRSEYGEASVSSVLNATIDGKLMMGYSNPYTSATGLNFLLEALASSGSDTIVDTAAVENFQKFQANVPLVSFTTQQMVQSADKGIVDGVVMEYQSYQNDPTLQRNYEFIPFGVRHDNPLYSIGSISAEKKEVVAAFVSLCAQNQAEATKDGFNGLDDYAYAGKVYDGNTIAQAQNHSERVIKNDEWGISDRLVNYPAVSITSNKITSLTKDLSKRAIICRIGAKIDNERGAKNSKRVNESMSELTTAFYGEYVRRMLVCIDEMTTEMRENANGKEYFPDIFHASSSVIADIFEACGIDLPDYVRILYYNDYMGDESIGRAAIEKIELAWQADPSKFRVDKKQNRLIYSYPPDGPWYELKYIADELPNSLEAEISGGNQLIMNYEQAQELFGIKFRRWLGIFNL